MNQNTIIEKRLVTIVKSCLPEETQAARIKSETHFITHLKINSTHIVDIVLDVEDSFDSMIDDEAIGKMNTLEDSVDLVLCRLLDSNIQAA